MGIPANNGIDAWGLPNAGDQATAVVSGTFTAIGTGDAFAFRGPMNLELYASLTNLAFTTTNGSLAASVSSGTGLAAGVAINSTNVPFGTTWATFSGTSGTLALPAYSYPVTGLSTQTAQITLPPGSNVNQLLGATVSVTSNRALTTIPAGTTVTSIFQPDIAPNSATGYAGQPGIIVLSTAPTAVPPNGVGVNGQPVNLRFKLGSAAITTGVDAAAVFTGAAISYSATVQLEKSFDGGATWIVGSLSNSGTLAQWTTGTPVSITFGEPERNVNYRLNCIAYTSGTITYRVSQTGGANESLSIGPLVSG